MTGQGPAVPQIVKYTDTYTSQKIYTNIWAPNQKEYAVIAGRGAYSGGSPASVPVGMKRSPPKKGAQYEICTEHVKH